MKTSISYLLNLFILAYLYARLAHGWQAFISRTHKLRKTFVSMNCGFHIWIDCLCAGWGWRSDINMVVSDDVDIRTMLNILQFYEVGFILMFIFSVITINKTVDILLRLSRLLTILWGWFYINVCCEINLNRITPMKWTKMCGAKDSGNLRSKCLQAMTHTKS